jgi:hypothetical protein
MTYSDQVPAAFRSFKVKVASIAQITTNPEISAGNNISITLQDADLNVKLRTSSCVRQDSATASMRTSIGAQFTCFTGTKVQTLTLRVQTLCKRV